MGGQEVPQWGQGHWGGGDRDWYPSGYRDTGEGGDRDWGRLWRGHGDRDTGERTDRDWRGHQWGQGHGGEDRQGHWERG